MAEIYRFFDSADPIEPDRVYNAEEFSEYFHLLIKTGVVQNMLDELSVTNTGENMVSTVNTGFAFIKGRYYENTEPLNLTHDTESIGNDRIDRIVLRLDLNTENRYIRAFIKKGKAGTSPVPPTLQQDDFIYEISLAQVYITGGQSFIDQESITDERGSEFAPWASSNILPDTTDALRIHEENVFVHNVDSDNVKLSYTGDNLTMVQEYSEGNLVKQTDLSYTNGDLTQVRERYYDEDGNITNDVTSTLNYTNGNLTEVIRSVV